MKPFTRLRAIIAPLPMANIDTDQIIPKQFLKTVERGGLGKGLFHDLRFSPDGAEKSDFVLNKPEYRRAGALVAGDNFGCGSSREHAPWALVDFGIRSVISTSFADIFYNNCFQNGILPVILGADALRSIMEESAIGATIVTVDLEIQTVIMPSGKIYLFEIDAKRKNNLLNGLDSIAETFLVADAIGDYEAQQQLAKPWLSSSPQCAS